MYAFNFQLRMIDICLHSVLGYVAFFITICYHTIYASPWIFPPLAFYGLDLLMRMLRYRIKDAVLVPVGKQMTLVCLHPISAPPSCYFFLFLTETSRRKDPRQRLRLWLDSWPTRSPARLLLRTTRGVPPFDHHDLPAVHDLHQHAHALARCPRDGRLDARSVHVCSARAGAARA